MKIQKQIVDFLSKAAYNLYRNILLLYKQATPEVEAVKQQKSINGIVADEQGEPIIGASVLEKGTTNGRFYIRLVYGGIQPLPYS